MYKRVLVATGGSPWSDAAVSYAIAWAACTGAELRILGVLASPAAYTVLLRWGNVPETILRTAAEEGCELITLGSRVVTGLKRLVVGRTLHAVAATARLPALVVKHPPAPPAGPAL